MPSTNILDNQVLSQNEFFSVLKLFFNEHQAEIVCPNTRSIYFETIELFSRIEPFIQAIQQDNMIIYNWVNSPRRHIDIVKLLETMKTIRIFPQFSQLKKNNSLSSGLIRDFLEFLEKHLVPKILNSEKAGQNFSQEHICKIYGKDWPERFLQEYQNHLLDQQIIPQNRSLGDELKKLQQDIIKDLEELVDRAGVLYVVALKIQFEHKLDHESREFSEFIYDQLEDRLQSLDFVESIIRVYYKRIIGHGNSIEYFVILLVQHIDNDFSESSIVSQVSQHLDWYYGDKNYRIRIHVQNLTNSFRQKILTSHHGSFFLSKFSITENTLVSKWFFSFLYQWEQFHTLNKYFINSTLSDGRYYSKASRSIGFECTNRPKTYQYLYSLERLERYKLIWKTAHLSAYAQTYIKNLKLVYKELLCSQRDLEKYSGLVEMIEIFMLTLKESPYVAFEKYKKFSKGSYQEQPIETTVTRSLLQFIQLATCHEDIIDLGKRFSRYHCSHLLNYFLDIYLYNAIDTYNPDDLEIRTVLGANLELSKNRVAVEKLLSNFIYPREIFLKQAIKAKAPDFQITTLYKRIDVPRHEARLERIKTYLNSGMKTDVVIIRCQLNCMGITITPSQKNLSSALYNMMHAGKRRAPLSYITGYLGFWESLDDASATSAQFCADVIFIFRHHALLQHSDLHKDIEEAWGTALKKTLELESLSTLIQPYVKEEIILHSVNELRTEQLIIEAIDLKRKKTFINSIVPLVTYRDLLHDGFYTRTPKWLISGTTPRTKLKRVRKLKKVDSSSSSKIT